MTVGLTTGPPERERDDAPAEEKRRKWRRRRRVDVDDVAVLVVVLPVAGQGLEEGAVHRQEEQLLLPQVRTLWLSAL